MSSIEPRTIENIRKDIAAELVAMGLLAGELKRFTTDASSGQFMLALQQAYLPAFAPRLVELSRELANATLAAAKAEE